jgi:calpain-15
VLNKPALFDGKVEPKDVVQGSLGECYFLSALAALAEKEDIIRRVFANQNYNQNGIYKVTLRVDGVVK